MMLVRQQKDSFIRIYEEVGYINNQLTKHDRAYNETGADFLSLISRDPQDVNILINKLCEIYDTTRNVLADDFYEFIKDLELGRFIVTGETPEDLNNKEFSFSYSMDNPKTLVFDFTQETTQSVNSTTEKLYIEMFKRIPHLFSLQFELTSRCNERCIHCYIPNNKKDNGIDMPTSVVLDILDQASEIGTMRITLSGGEVFMHKDIDLILRYCRGKDFQINILSNLLLINDDHIKLLKEINPSIVQTSLYSMVADEHDSITTVKGSFKRTKRAIEKLVAADIPIQISCPVMKANVNAYKDVLLYAKSLNCKAQSDYIMMAQADCNTSNLSNRISIEETENLLRDIIENDYDYEKETLKLTPITANLEDFKNQPLCGAGIDSICVSANGDYYPCAGWQGMVVGNAHKERLMEIWENSLELNTLRKITNGSFPDCLLCDARDYCAMCLVRNFNENKGDMFTITKHFCDVAFLNKKMVENHLAKNNH